MVYSFSVTDALEEEIEKMHLQNTCKVCLTESSDRVFQPCGHLSCCSTCTKRLRDCPICRLPIEASVVVVLPKPRKKTANNFVDFDLFLKKQKYFGIPESERYALFWERWCGSITILILLFLLWFYKWMHLHVLGITLLICLILNLNLNLNKELQRDRRSIEIPSKERNKEWKPQYLLTKYCWKVILLF